MLIPGIHRSDVPYVWPSRFFQPAFDTKLVYLDLNHWIYLAKAATGHQDGARHCAALETLRRAAASSQFLFPLSGTHYMEMQGIQNPRWRRDITDVMEELTGFRTLLSRAAIIQMEVEAALDDLATPRPQPLYPPVTLIGDGVFHTFGPRGGLHGGLRGGLPIYNAEGEDVTETTRLEFRDGPEAFDRWQAENELLLERSILRGPTDEEAPDLRARGWRPETNRRIAEERAQQEQSQQFAVVEQGRSLRGRTRDEVAARHLFFELNELVATGLVARGRQLDEVFTDVATARRFTDSMPSSDIAITLTTARHRNPQTRWSANDIFDIDAMSVAVPYCDIVVTEQHACHVLKTARADRRANTQLLTELNELAALIEAAN